MRRLLLALALLGADIVPARADALFSPRDDVPDHVATYTDHAIHRRAGIEVTVRHHGDWTRIDRSEGGHPATEFHARQAATAIRVYGNGPRLSIERGRERPPTSEANQFPRNTGERQVFLGESCTIWDVWRLPPGETGLTARSCVTDDGIELWHKAVSRNGLISSLEATKIERRPVTPDEAQPPRSLLALDWWNSETAAAGEPPTPQHEVVLRFDNSDTERTRTVRVSPSWRLADEMLNSKRYTLSVAQHSSARSLYAAYDDSGAPRRLNVGQRTPPPADSPPPIDTKPKDLGRGDTVLGERCRWFDMTPNMMDANTSACRTNDGIVLKEQRSSRMATQVWSAIKLTRRPIALREVTPPAALFDPKTWGIP